MIAFYLFQTSFLNEAVAGCQAYVVGLPVSLFLKMLKCISTLGAGIARVEGVEGSDCSKKTPRR